MIPILSCMIHKTPHHEHVVSGTKLFFRKILGHQHPLMQGRYMMVIGKIDGKNSNVKAGIKNPFIDVNRKNVWWS